jgi:hypothetical protein
MLKNIINQRLRGETNDEKAEEEQYCGKDELEPNDSILSLANRPLNTFPPSKNGNRYTSGKGLSPLEIFGIFVGSLRKKENISEREITEILNVDKHVIPWLELGQLELEKIIPLLPALEKALRLKPGQLQRALLELILDREE